MRPGPSCSGCKAPNGGEKLYTERGEIFPALQSVANSPAFMTDQPPANKKAIITEAKASGVGGFGYFPEWDELQGTIINPAPGQDLDRRSGSRKGVCRSCASRWISS